jgi:predicted nucleic acid-binding protein
MTQIETLVVDASVVVKWYVPEAGSTEASELLRDRSRKLAPDLLVAEFGNVLWKKVRRGELQIAEAAEIAGAFVSACPLTLVPASPYLGPALEIATRWQRTVYDALYLAIALAEDCALITADARFVEGLKTTEMEGAVRLLGST